MQISFSDNINRVYLKKISALAVIFFSLTACQPDYTVKQYLSSLQQGNIDKAYQYLSSSDQKYMKSKDFYEYLKDDFALQGIPDKEALATILKKITFEIKDVQKQKDKTLVSYKSKVPDISRVMDTFGNRISEKEIEPFTQLLNSTLERKKIPTSLKKGTFEVIKNDWFRWRIFLNFERFKKLELLQKTLDQGRISKATKMLAHIEKHYPDDNYVAEKIYENKLQLKGIKYSKKYLKLGKITVKKHKKLKKFLDIKGKIYNNGSQAVNKLVIEINYQGFNEQTIYTGKYHILDPAGFALANNNAPLKGQSSRSFKFGDSQVPISQWNNKVNVRITLVELGLY